MDKTKAETGNLENSRGVRLSIPDFCDTKLFEQLLQTWATATGLGTMAYGCNGKYKTAYYNFTDFCEQLTRRSPEGLRRCTACDKKGRGVYLCHAGLVDFASDITLEDGTVIGKILGGQVLPQRPDEVKFRATARELGIDEKTYIEALRRVNVRTPEQIQAAAKLLASVVNMFVRTSYAERQNARKLALRSDIITSLSKIYFCNYYVNLETDQFLELDATPEIHAVWRQDWPASRILAESPKIFVAPRYVQEFSRFADLKTLPVRLEHRHNLALEYVSQKYGWCRAHFIVVARDIQGRASQVLFAIQDIHGEKERELKNLQLLQQTAAAAERANRVKSDFLARMSHDMRTPLTTIIGLSDLASARYQDRELQEYFTTIKNSSAYLQSILTEVLDMQKLASGTVKLQSKVCQPVLMARTVEGIIRNQAETKKITLQTTFPWGEQPLYLLADVRRTEQIIINLLNNAVKYTQPGGKVTWSVTVQEQEERLVLVHTITDNGPGIPPEFQKIMFEPFTQGENGFDTSGSGLGLAIVHKLVELMGGSIVCVSAPGQGTSFTVTLPHAKPDAAQIKAYLEQRQPAAPVVFKDFKVLVCEDNAINAQIIQKLLQVRNIQTERAENGARAVQLAQTKKYDAILMDLRMPVLDGYGAARQIREFDQTTPIIALSANTFPEDIDRSLACGMNAHLAKPVDTAALYAALHKFAPKGEQD